MINLNWKTVVAIGGVAGVGYMLAKRELKEVASTVGGAVNPVSDQNIFYRGVNSVGSTLSGDESFTLGGWIYEVTHNNE